VAGGLAFGVAFAVGFGIREAVDGVTTGLAISIVTALILGLDDGSLELKPQRHPVTSRWIFARIGNASIGGLLVATAVGLGSSLLPAIGAGLLAALILWLVFGPGIGLMRVLGRRRRPPRADDSGDGLYAQLRGLFDQLYRAIPVAGLFCAPIGIVAGISGGLVSGIAAFENEFLTLALICIVLLGLGLAGRRGVPERVNWRPRGRLRQLVRHVRDGVVAGAVYGAANGMFFVVLEMATVLVIRLARGHGLSVTASQVEASGAIFLIGLTVGLVTGISRGVARWLNTPVDLVSAPSPSEVMRNARLAAVVWTVISVCILGLTVLIAMVWFSDVAVSERLRYGLAYGLPIGVVGGVLAITGSTWGQSLLLRAALAAQRLTPFRLAAFLNDAHARGVLRTAGAVFQFRHIRLQERLASFDQGLADHRPLTPLPEPITNPSRLAKT
jgi:hypothetical protein